MAILGNRKDKHAKARGLFRWKCSFVPRGRGEGGLLPSLPDWALALVAEKACTRLHSLGIKGTPDITRCPIGRSRYCGGRRLADEGGTGTTLLPALLTQSYSTDRCANHKLLLFAAVLHRGGRGQEWPSIMVMMMETTTRGGLPSSRTRRAVDVARLLAATDKVAESLQQGPAPGADGLRAYSIQLNRVNAVGDGE